MPTAHGCQMHCRIVAKRLLLRSVNPAFQSSSHLACIVPINGKGEILAVGHLQLYMVPLEVPELSTFSHIRLSFHIVSTTGRLTPNCSGCMLS